jgi:hypothetical protein
MIPLFFIKERIDVFKKANSRLQTMRVLLRLGRAYEDRATIKQHCQCTGAFTGSTGDWGEGNINGMPLLLYKLFNLSNKDSAYYHIQHNTTLKDSIEWDLSAQKLAFYKTQAEREKAQASIIF